MDGNETRSYKVAMNREPADVRLKTLTVTPVNGTLLSFSPSLDLDTEAQTFRVRVSSDTDAVTVSVEKNSGDPRVRLMRTETLRLDSIDEDPDLAGIQFELTMDRFDLGGARENRYKSIWVIGPNSTRFFNRRVYQLWITKAAEGVGHATAADPLMAAFENAPLSHDGSSAFTFRMAFTEDVEITPEDMRDHAFVVSGATVTGAERVGGLKSLWELTLEPTGSGPVSILTPLERACTEAGALCTADGRSLSVAPALQVAGPVPVGAGADGELRVGAAGARRVDRVHVPDGVQRGCGDNARGHARPCADGDRRDGDRCRDGGRSQGPVGADACALGERDGVDTHAAGAGVHRGGGAVHRGRAVADGRSGRAGARPAAGAGADGELRIGAAGARRDECVHGAACVQRADSQQLQAPARRGAVGDGGHGQEGAAGGWAQRPVGVDGRAERARGGDGRVGCGGKLRRHRCAVHGGRPGAFERNHDDRCGPAATDGGVRVGAGGA